MDGKTIGTMTGHRKSIELRLRAIDLVHCMQKTRWWLTALGITGSSVWLGDHVKVNGVEDVSRKQTRLLGYYPMDGWELMLCFNPESIMAGMGLGSSLWRLWLLTGQRGTILEDKRPGVELVMELTLGEILALGNLVTHHLNWWRLVLV